MAEGPAWDLAREAASLAGVELRPLEALEDADRILDVMIATWGDHQLVPKEMIRALADSGNVPWGAFDGDTLVGYVMGWAGVDARDGLHVHSHMLAALPDRRHRGVGYALKLAQRAQALDQGIRVVRWTFDPLISRNAYFNIAKLGTLCDRFERNFYGEMTDVLNRGDRSDRLVVRWDLDRPVGPRPIPPGKAFFLLRRSGPEDLPRPERADDRGAGSPRIQIPREYLELRDRAPALATEWREVVGAVLEECFALGLIVGAFDAASESGPSYVLATPEVVT